MVPLDLVVSSPADGAVTLSGARRLAARWQHSLRARGTEAVPAWPDVVRGAGRPPGGGPQQLSDLGRLGRVELLEDGQRLPQVRQRLVAPVQRQQRDAELPQAGRLPPGGRPARG
jgi:hypothetical protein